MLKSDHVKPKWSHILVWIALSGLAMPIAWLIAIGILSLITGWVGGTIQVGGQTRITEDYLMSYLFLPLLGLTTGFFQYLLLRRYFGRMGWWIPASLAGWSLPILVFQLIVSTLVQIPQSPGSMLLIAALIGFLIAIPQWLVLRRRLARAVWWLAAGAIGWGLAIGLVSMPLSNMFGMIAIILPPALSTGLVLYFLTRRQALGASPHVMQSV